MIVPRAIASARFVDPRHSLPASRDACRSSAWIRGRGEAEVRRKMRSEKNLLGPPPRLEMPRPAPRMPCAHLAAQHRHDYPSLREGGIYDEEQR